MELEHSFTVPVPEERAWEVLLDVERVAPCMPGASLDSVDGDLIAGRIKVKVGPIAMTYAGTARFTERDPSAHVITLEASGKETRGAGTASATVRSMLAGQGSQTHVIVHTTLNVTGRPAQFGRGVMAEIGGKLIGIFAANLADMLTADGSAGDGGAAEVPGAASGGAAETPGVAETPGAAKTPGVASEAAGKVSSVGPAAPVEELNLSLRSYNSLRKDGIHTVGDLASRTQADLLAIEHIGPASIEEIKQKLAARGLSLSESAAASNGLHTDGPGAGDTAPLGAGDTAPLGAGDTAPLGAGDTAPLGAGATAGTTAGSADGPAARPAPPGTESRPADDDAIDLLSVAGMPVLKRALPIAAVLAVLAVVFLRLRRRRRRADR